MRKRATVIILSEIEREGFTQISKHLEVSMRKKRSGEEWQAFATFFVLSHSSHYKGENTWLSKSTSLERPFLASLD